MKKHCLPFFLIAPAMLAACGGSVSPAQSVADAISKKSALIMHSATNRGLEIGENGVNKLKYPEYLYVFTKFSTPIEGGVATADISWNIAPAGLFTDKEMDADIGQHKYTPTFGAEDVQVKFTGTITYEGATASVVFNVTLLAKAE